MGIEKGLASFLSIALAPACVAVELDVPEVCVRQSGIALHAFAPPVDGEPFEISVGDSFMISGVDLIERLNELDAEAIAQLHGITLHAVEGAGDMSFVSEAFARIEPMGADSDLAPIDLGCRSGACRAVGAQLELAPATVTDMLRYAQAEMLSVEFGLTGTLPQEDLMLDVDVCMMAHVNLRRDP